MNTLVVGLGRINIKNKDGGAIRLYNVLRRFIVRKVEVDVLIPERDLGNFRDHRVKANFHLLTDPRWMGDNIVLLYTWRIVRGVLFALNYNQKADIVYSASDFWHDFLPALAYKLKNPSKKLVTCLFLMAPPPWKKYEDMYSNRISFPRLWTTVFYITQRFTILLGKFFGDAFFVLNETDKEKLISFGILQKKVFVVSMGVDIPKKFSKDVTKKFDGIFLGRLHPQKGLSDLLEIWQRVVVERPKAKLAIIGGGSANDIRKLLTDIEQHGLMNNIKYLGYLDGQDKERILFESRIMLVPSHYESWGQVLIEGVAAGLPVITYKLPIFSKVFGNNIISVELFNIKKFAQAVLKLLPGQSRGSEIFVVRPSFIYKYSWNIIAEREIVLFNNLLRS